MSPRSAPPDAIEAADGGPSLATRVAVPVAVGIAMLALWEFLVWYWQVPKFVLPAPSMIAESFRQDYPTLFASLWITLEITVLAFLIALVAGVALATLFAQSEIVEMSLFPYAVILQVTPIVSIAPLILIWVGLDHIERALLILATIVAFFPILSNMTLGLKSVDHNLRSLFDLWRHALAAAERAAVPERPPKPYMEARDRFVASPPPASTLTIVSGFSRPEFKVEVEAVAASAAA
ncbi:MAG TPA: ABC transporter permease subunit [Beijerinckiaceae bacterium]|jgi:ABC-type nitrate/sulfonate/bicarbonate transport system permease component